jgi:hypothetical protein
MEIKLFWLISFCQVGLPGMVNAAVDRNGPSDDSPPAQGPCQVAKTCFRASAQGLIQPGCDVSWVNIIAFCMPENPLFFLSEDVHDILVKKSFSFSEHSCCIQSQNTQQLTVKISNQLNNQSICSYNCQCLTIVEL